MEIRPEILDRHLAEAAVEQLAADYAEKGFKVTRDEKLGDVRADLVARRGDELIVFEVKAGNWTPAEREAVKRLRNYAVRDRGARFVLVLAQQPSGKLVEIAGLEERLAEIVDERCKEELSGLSTHTRVKEVTGVDLASVTIGAEGIEVRGSASVEFELQFGSASDLEKGQGFTSSETVPVTFHLSLDLNLRLREVWDLKLDLGSLLE